MGGQLTCLFVIYLEYIKVTVTHTHCDVQLNTYSRIYNPEQSIGIDFHWGPQIIYLSCKGITKLRPMQTSARRSETPTFYQ